MKLFFVLSIFLFVTAWVESEEKPRQQARSMVITKFGIVATSQTLASAAGTYILEQGGNAIDAAIAANAVLGVVEPTSNGIGGDLFAIVYHAKSGRLYGLNASGWSPSGLTMDLLKSQGMTSMPQKGIYSVTVPGCVAGWEALRNRFGRMDLSRLLSPAIYYANDGYPVTEIISNSWQRSADFLSSYRNSKETFLINGRAPRIGEVFKNADLAHSLQKIAKEGRNGFYRGSIADAILEISRENGGTFVPADLSEYEPEWVDPISTTYRGWTVFELPPNGQGIAALSMLNLMEQFPLEAYGHNSARALHIMIEAKKLAYADMLQYVGDPRFSKVPVTVLLSKRLAKQRATLIIPEKSNCQPDPANLTGLNAKLGGDTIYMSTIDREGNIVSLIQSNYSGFGSGLVPPKTGFMLHNRGALFVLDRGSPNSLEPHKRPLHTIIPAFMEKEGIQIGFGIMGGWNQAQAHAQFVSNVVDFGMNIQQALEAARFTKLTFEGCDVQLENRITEESRNLLIKWGHKLEILGPFSGLMGGGQAVMRDRDRVNYGGSDPRKDGAAIPSNPRW